MSLLPAFVLARMRNDDSAQPAGVDSHSPEISREDNVFDLVPPESSAPAEPEPAPEPPARAGHLADLTDLSRLSIDADNRLYWDGKPVETHHHFLMSRKQIVGASIVAAFIVIGALGAAIQGAAAARDWACRLGWTSGSCSGAPPTHSSDIPA